MHISYPRDGSTISVNLVGDLKNTIGKALMWLIHDVISKKAVLHISVKEENGIISTLIEIEGEKLKKKELNQGEKYEKLVRNKELKIKVNKKKNTIQFLLPNPYHNE